MSKISRAKTYWILAISMAVTGLLEAISGFILWLGFPSGGGGGGLGRAWGGGGIGQLTFWELSKHTWTDIHDWAAVALVALVVIHVALHWKWIARMAKSMFRGTPRRVPIKVTTS